MLPSTEAPNLTVPVENLTQTSFAPFGTVVENPAHAGLNAPETTHKVVPANQGTALKYIDVSHLTNYYGLAPSGQPAKAVMNMFVCSPRRLLDLPSTNGEGHTPAFPVQILERHPYTPQTFIPTGLSLDDTSTAYLVVVAPTLPTSSKGDGLDASRVYSQEVPTSWQSLSNMFSKARPTPLASAGRTPAPVELAPGVGPQSPKGSGRPDLANIRAFIAHGGQSVTYGPGTWHAPMVVLGAKSIDFVVVQYANGVALEDCQEIEIRPEPGSYGLHVAVRDNAALKLAKAKL